MKILNIIILTIILASISYAEEQNLDDGHFIDKWHKKTYNSFKEASEYVDKKLVETADKYADDNNETKNKKILEQYEKELKEKNNKKAKRKKHADKFFLSDKFIEETNEPFLRVTPEGRVNSKSNFDDKIRLKVRAHLPLSRSKKRFRLFIGNLDSENIKDTLNNDNGSSKPEIGVNYFSPDYYGIRSKYSIGIHGIYPFGRARYSTDFNPGNWDLEFVQTFEYYVDDGFEERTQGYFDTTFLNLSLFRLFVERGTKEKDTGMYYSTGAIMFWQPSYKTGLTLTQAFFGGTKYRYTKNNNIYPEVIEEHSGINKYYTSLKYRQNFFRKWLFYELEPALDFDIRNNFQTNYSLVLRLDIFYGEL